MSEIETKTVITYGADFLYRRVNPSVHVDAPNEWWSPLVWDHEDANVRDAVIAALVTEDPVRVRTWTRESTHLTTYDD